MQITIRYRPIDWNAWWVWVDDLAVVGGVVACIYLAFFLGVLCGRL